MQNIMKGLFFQPTIIMCLNCRELEIHNVSLV